MNRFYQGQSAPMQQIFNESIVADTEFLQRRFEFSERALALLVEAGGVTRSEYEFTLAMHGFGRGDFLSQSNAIVMHKYDEINDMFGEAAEQPVASIASRHDSVDTQHLTVIGRVPHVTFDMRSVSDMPLQFRIEDKGGHHRGYVELPVEQYHEWTEGKWWGEDPTLNLEDTATMVVATVGRTANKFGYKREGDDAVQIDTNIKVGMGAIMASYVFDERAHGKADSQFLDRIRQARANFQHRYPIEVGAD